MIFGFLLLVFVISTTNSANQCSCPPTTKAPGKKVEPATTKKPISAPKPPSVLDCMCTVESNCKPLGCKADSGAGGALSCGYYQITLNYFLDCNEVGKKPGESSESAWKRCSLDKGCSIQCIEKYVERYKQFCPGKSLAETMARLHNGGPGGCKAARTVSYWQKVQKCCKCN